MAHSYFPTRSSAEKWARENLCARWFYPHGLPEDVSDLDQEGWSDPDDCVIIEELDPYHQTKDSKYYVYYHPSHVKKDDPMQDSNYVGHRIHY